MTWRCFLGNTSGAAASEFAMILPMAIIVLFTGSEAGHFVWTQHKLTEAVRNGARYAARLDVNDVCDGSTEILADPQLAEVKLLTRTGQMESTTAKPVVKGWTAAQVDVVVNCESFIVDPTVSTGQGIYTDLGTRGPVVTVSASNVSYPALFGLLGGLSSAISLNARSNAAVIGI